MNTAEQNQESSGAWPNRHDAQAAGYGGVDILSDMWGFDFGSYLQGLLKTVRQKWYLLSPPAARAPQMRRGVVSIELSILKDGRLKGMRLVGTTADVPMGNAAWHRITDTRFPPLPSEFSGQYLSLRLKFVYNPEEPSDAILQFRE